MFVFGTFSYVKTMPQQGQFYCPHCRVTSTYAECRRKKHFFVFFIPVVTLDDSPCGVRCTSCQNTFDDNVLSYSREKLAESWRCPQCNRKWPETNVRCPFCKVRPNGTPA